MTRKIKTLASILDDQVDDFTQAVLDFCRHSAEAIAYLCADGESTVRLKTLLNNLVSFDTKIEIIVEPDTSSTDNEGQYRLTYLVLKFTSETGQEVYVKILCDLSSYGGLSYLSHKIVAPKTKTIEVFE